MWRGAMWTGLMRWCEEDETFARELVVRQAARSTIREVLNPGRLSKLEPGEFVHAVVRSGCVCHSGGQPVPPGWLESRSPGRIARMFSEGELAVSGNCMLDGERVHQGTLPGLAATSPQLCEHLGRLLTAAPSDAPGLIDEAAADGSPLSAAVTSLVLCLCTRSRCAIYDRTRLLGLLRLDVLLGGEGSWSEATRDYHQFNAAVEELRSASAGVLDDPLAADLLLCRLADLREPQAWKIAIGLSETRAESAAVARLCLDGGFAAIASDDPDDTRIARLRSLVPGDCVVMHLRGRIGAIGRVTCPYYEIDRRCASPRARRWWRRVGVEWIVGDRDYGSLLTGAQQRFAVVGLDWEAFRAIAAMYRHDAEYDRLMRPLHGGWLLHCPSDRRESLLAVERPLPLRDQWTVQLAGPRPSSGDTIFLYHDSSPRGVWGIATVISEPRRHAGGYRIELVYERLLSRPISTRSISADPRLGDWSPDSGEDLAHLQADAAVALRALLQFPPRRHFALLSNGRPGAQRPEEQYRLGSCSDAQTQQLAEAASRGTARCLIYHAAPENAFVGFGTVLGLSERSSSCRDAGAPEVRMNVLRFAHKARGWSIGSRMPTASRASSTEREKTTRTVLSISADDFYRVLAAGMGGSSERTSVTSIEELAQRSGAPPERLEEIERLLRDRGQMIFYGPPGTGKTYLALRLAEYLAEGDGARQEVVQFHPAYSYEDFIEGIRPRVVESADGLSHVDYPVVPGAFLDFCERARRDAQNTYAFVIDEINRAHVAEVFGELMLALEYRDREVRLAHSPGDRNAGSPNTFSVPRNVLLIATMNTADRSIALMDHALRRRFVFYPLFPDDPDLVRPMFLQWLETNAPEMVWAANLLDLLNERIERELGRQFLIGHSYFMRGDLSESNLSEIWRFQLRPLIEEYFAGTPERVREIELDDLIWQAREVQMGSLMPSPPPGSEAGGQLWLGRDEGRS